MVHLKSQEIMARQIERAEELERRLVIGVDDPVYCAKWDAFHRRIIAAVRQAMTEEIA